MTITKMVDCFTRNDKPVSELSESRRYSGNTNDYDRSPIQRSYKDIPTPYYTSDVTPFRYYTCKRDKTHNVYDNTSRLLVSIIMNEDNIKVRQVASHQPKPIMEPII